MYNTAKTISPVDPKQVFDMQTNDERNSFLKEMGARNCLPPLPRSSHLLIKATGRVLPYDPMFAEQQDLVVNCDASGNTDPNAWMPTVLPDISIDEYRNEIEIQRLRSIEMGNMMTSGFKQNDMTPIRMENIPEGVVSFSKFGESGKPSVSEDSPEVKYERTVTLENINPPANTSEAPVVRKKNKA